jgi:hypothetical protein
VENEENPSELDRLDGSESIAVMIANNFKNAGATESFQGLCVPMRGPLLRHKQGVTNAILNCIWKVSEVLLA